MSGDHNMNCSANNLTIKDDDICGICYEGLGISYSLNKETQTLVIKKGEAFQTWLTKPLLTDNGKTVGERNRENLHQWLDSYLDNGDFDNVS